MIKKLLIVPVVLALVIFNFYPESAVGKDTKGNHTALPKTDLAFYQEVVEVYNTDFAEMNKTETVEEEDEKKVFSVEISGELNTTKEKVITLTAMVENSDNITACNYFWSENNVSIGIGETLEMAFTKGEHVLSVRALGSNGAVAHATVTVRAYDYYMVTRLHYNAYYGNLEYTEKEIQNHKGKYLLRDDGTYVRDSYIYDDEDRMIENKYVYYDYPENSQTVRYEYDEEGNELKVITLNSEGEIIYLVLNTYEDGNLTSSLSGQNEDSLSSENYNERYGYPVYTEVAATEEEETDTKNSEDRIEYNDNGKITYEEVNYGSMKLIYEYGYDEKDRIIKRTSSMQSDTRFSSRSSFYDENLNISSFERKYGNENGLKCHYRTLYTHNSKDDIATKEDQLIQGDCPYLSEVKKSYVYDANGLVISVDSSVDGEKSYSTLEVIKLYTNDLEMD